MTIFNRASRIEIQVKINYNLQQCMVKGIISKEDTEEDLEIKIIYEEKKTESTFLRIILDQEEWNKKLKEVYDSGFEDGYEQGVINSRN